MKLLLACAVLVASCAGRSELEWGRRAAGAGDWDAAVAHYEEALRREPDDLEARIVLQRARLEASHAHLRLARQHQDASDLESAALELELALGYDPTNRYAMAELAEIRRELEEGAEPPPAVVSREGVFGAAPLVDPLSDAPLDLHFAEATSLRTILETLAKLAGVNILFDDAFRDRQVTVDLTGVSFEEALELLLSTNGLFYKVVHSRAVQVEPAPVR